MVDEIIKERMLRNLKGAIVDRWGCDDNEQEVLRKLFLTELVGCMPDEYIGDDLLVEIRAKFDRFYESIIKEIETERFIEVWIDPSYDDITGILIVLDNKLLFKDNEKAWNFWYESEEALMDSMYRIYRLLLEGTIKTWDCYTLSEDDIKEVAEQKGLDLEGRDWEDIIHYIKKGIAAALDNRDEIIEEAIKQAGKGVK